MNPGMALFSFLDHIGMKKETKDESTSDEVFDVRASPNAIQHKDGNGLLHREDGPALIHPDGGTEWWWHGKRHREDGPAVETASGTKEWYMNNQNHRIGGPAVVKSCGDTCWYQEGRLHREHGPAFEGGDGTNKWYLKGNLHREDGPAVEKKSTINGQTIRSWYWEGRQVTEPEVLWRAREKSFKGNPPKMGKDLKHLHAINGMPHNPNGPARVWHDDSKEWFLNGRRHRIDGPAVMLANGEEYYYLCGMMCSKTEHAIRVSKPNEVKTVEYIKPTSTPTSSTVEVPPVVPMPSSAMVVVPKEESKEESKVEESEDEKDKNKVKSWPDEPNEILLYKDIYAPFKNILEKGYRLIRNGTEWKFDYNGYEIGKQEKKLFPNIKEHFTEKFLKREKEKHDQSLMDVVMRLLFLMGVEQGRRMAYQEQTPVRSLEKTLATYRERNKSVRYQLAKANAVIKIREENPAVTPDEVNELIEAELEKTRQSRLEEIKKEIKMDPTLTCFKSKAKKKTKFADLLALANTLDGEIFKQPDWLALLEEANCSPGEWKAFCKKNKFHKFIG